MLTFLDAFLEFYFLLKGSNAYTCLQRKLGPKQGVYTLQYTLTHLFLSSLAKKGSESGQDQGGNSNFLCRSRLSFIKKKWETKGPCRVL